VTVCTVAIPVYNQHVYVERALRSVLAQNLPGIQVLVVDNQSDDGTWEVLQPFAAGGVILQRNASNLGLFGNFNRCLELAATPYLRILAGDDMLVPGCLELEIALMERHPQLAMLSTRGRYVGPNGAALGDFACEFPPGIYAGQGFARKWFEYYARYRSNPLNYPSGVLFRRAAIGEQRFELSLRTAGDIDFYFRVLRRGDLGITDLHGCDVTRHPGQAHVGPNLDGTAIREQLALVERFIEGPPRAALRKYLAGTCLALALRRYGRAESRPSSKIHLRLAAEISPNPVASAFGLLTLAACRAARGVAGRRAPYIPRPVSPL